MTKHPPIIEMLTQQEIDQLAFLYLVDDRSKSKDVKFIDVIVESSNTLKQLTCKFKFNSLLNLYFLIFYINEKEFVSFPCVISLQENEFEEYEKLIIQELPKIVKYFFTNKKIFERRV